MVRKYILSIALCASMIALHAMETGAAKDEQPVGKEPNGLQQASLTPAPASKPNSPLPTISVNFVQQSKAAAEKKSDGRSQPWSLRIVEPTCRLMQEYPTVALVALAGSAVGAYYCATGAGSWLWRKITGKQSKAEEHFRAITSGVDELQGIFQSQQRALASLRKEADRLRGQLDSLRDGNSEALLDSQPGAALASIDSAAPSEAGPAPQPGAAPAPVNPAALQALLGALQLMTIQAPSGH